MKKKICVFTGNRAEYGLLKPLLLKLKKDKNFDLQLVVTGAHLSHEFGLTYKDIEADNFIIDEKVEILISSDTPSAITKTMGVALISFSHTIEKLKPDLVIILGDRYEALAFAIASHIFRIPIAHIHGGEITYGAIDDAFRHSITKLSLLHFTSTEEYRQNIIQMGENPNFVFNVGAIGLDNFKEIKLLKKKQVEFKISKKFKKNNFLITFHPVTLDNNQSSEQFKNILMALDKFEDTLLIFTKANADTHGRIINKMIDEYVSQNAHKAVAFNNMGQRLYLSTMQYVDVVIGNSSSGIIEAPSLKVPTVNIGDRQSGRIKAKSIIDTDYNADNIYLAIKTAISKDFKNLCKNIINPYGSGDTSSKIMNVLKSIDIQNLSLKKTFYNANLNNT